MYGRRRERKGGFCLPGPLARAVGLILLAAGLLILIVCVPLRYWMALLGLLMAAAGLALRLLF